MDMPLVSIIIPVYNGSNYLRCAIDSALEQTYQNIEILVINDGSKDNNATEDIALSYGSRIRYFKKENGGVATALNMGIQQMRGDYFSWLSHDDIYYPSKIETQINILNRENRPTAIVFSNYDYLREETKMISSALINEGFDTSLLEDSVFPVLKGKIHGCTLLIHRSHFERVGLFDEKLLSTQDYDLWFRMFRNQRLIYINQPLIIGRLHKDQGSNTIQTHSKQEAELRIRFAKSLYDDEINRFYGNRYYQYYELLMILGRDKSMDEYQYALQVFRNEEMPEDVLEKINALRSFLADFSDNKADKICIFGAGYYGLSLCQRLRLRLIKIDSLSDNDLNKWGKYYNYVACIQPSDIDIENTLVIVAVKNPKEIVNQLVEMGCRYVITYKDVEEIVEKTPPLKWLVEAEQISQIDYPSPEIVKLIDQYNQTVYEICQYYEGKKMRNNQ